MAEYAFSAAGKSVLVLVADVAVLVFIVDQAARIVCCIVVMILVLAVTAFADFV